MADIKEAADRGEATTMMEPLLISEDSRHRGLLVELVVELASKASGFRRSLPASIVGALAALVRSMNCYYSNLIEGHDTHPIDIERALKQDYSADAHKRDLQLEARAHISVQSWIDEGGLRDRAVMTEGLLEIHRRFCAQLPDDLLWCEDPYTHEKVRIVPGQLRTRDVQVGRHVSVSPGAAPRFLSQFERVYQRLGRTDTILATAAAHHRLLWIHPFLDGNGRVARLMSHAVLLDALDSGGVWSVSRGLARNVAGYKAHLADCDLQRRNDLDGRGNLSEETLASFTRFFLETCIDQVAFMESLMQPERLRARILRWAEEEASLDALPTQAASILEAILYRGEMPRGDLANILGVTPRHARRIASMLLERGVLASKGPRDPLTLAFPATLASAWMPGLFPDRPA
ncbi:MAG: Fic family protein [Roseiarcus sp.]